MAQPAGTHPVTLDSGEILYVPDRYGPEETTRLQREYNRVDAANANPNQVPSGANPGDPNVKLAYPEPDPSKSDSYLTAAGKHIGAAVQGTGRGLAGLADLGISGINAAGEMISNPIRRLRGEEPRSTGFMHPLTEAYDANLPAAPEGYQNTADWSEMFGPIAVTEAVSGGMATPWIAPLQEATLASRIGKIGMETLAKPALKTPFIGGTGYVGGEVGGGVSDLLGGGEDAHTLATIIGSATLPAAAMPGVKAGVRKLTMDANSAAKVARLKRQGIDPTFADVGKPGVQTFQDVTGRGLFGGDPAFHARAELYKRLEQAWIDNVNVVRGRASGTPDPVTGLVSSSTITPERPSGPITKESIGGELKHTADESIADLEKFKSAVQEKLLRDIGPDTSVDPTPFYDRMNSVIAKVGDAGLRDQLYKIVDDFDRNVPGMPNYDPPKIDPVTGQPPPKSGLWDQVLTKQPTFSAVQGNRSNVGNTMNPTGTRNLNSGYLDQAYHGMTDAMRAAAEKQGMPISVFDEMQAQTDQAYSDIGGMKAASEAANSGAGFNTIFSGAGKQSLEPLQPFIDNNPGDMARVMANALDLSVRGPGRAGDEIPDPTKLDINKMDRVLATTNPDYLLAQTGGVPEVDANIKDIGEIAHNEAIRKGQRTLPGKSSTIGALSGLFPGAGAIGGLALGGIPHDMVSAITTGLYGLAGAAAGEGGTYALGKLMTNPHVVEAIANPVNKVSTGWRRALQGANAEAGHLHKAGRTSQENQWEEDLGRRYVK